MPKKVLCGAYFNFLFGPRRIILYLFKWGGLKPNSFSEVRYYLGFPLESIPQPNDKIRLPCPWGGESVDSVMKQSISVWAAAGGPVMMITAGPPPMALLAAGSGLTSHLPYLLSCLPARLPARLLASSPVPPPARLPARLPGTRLCLPARLPVWPSACACWNISPPSPRCPPHLTCLPPPS